MNSSIVIIVRLVAFNQIVMFGALKIKKKKKKKNYPPKEVCVVVQTVHQGLEIQHGDPPCNYVAHLLYTDAKS